MTMLLGESEYSNMNESGFMARRLSCVSITSMNQKVLRADDIMIKNV